MSNRLELRLAVGLGAWLALSCAAAAQDEPPSSPYEAYQEGRYDEALEGFLDEEVTSPEDPRVLANRGSAQYKLGEYDEAAEAFRRAAEAEERRQRARALYNLGNTAYRQQRLEEAIDYYRQAIELAPDDLDAKFNLEYVQRQRELQQQQQQQQDQQQGEQEETEEGQQGESGGDSQQQDRQQDQQSQGDQDSSESSQSQGGAGEADQTDSDNDGVPDERERGGSNPTDPQDPDSDDDGLPDGAEDLDRDGSLDPGETDPNRADSDGDGIPDGADPSPTGNEPSTSGAQQQAQQGMTPEEAQRYLDALEEGRPNREAEARGQRTRSGKDW